MSALCLGSQMIQGQRLGGVFDSMVQSKVVMCFELSTESNIMRSFWTLEGYWFPACH